MSHRLLRVVTWPYRCSRWLWQHRPENFYRDIWLLGISVIVLIALSNQGKQTDDIQTQTGQLVVIAKVNRMLTKQLCEVVINVHTTSVARVQAERSRLRSERRRVDQTLEYLRSLSADEASTNLTRRVRANLPSIREDVQAQKKVTKVAKQSAVATRPPKACLQVSRGRSPSPRTGK